jgi:hypothetical protein
MRTMAETPLLPAYSEPVTERRWAVTRFGKTLDSVRVILILGEQQNLFFYAVQGSKAPELRSIRKKAVVGRYETKDDADTAILRAKLAWDARSEKVSAARRMMRDAESARDEAWEEALREPVRA